MQFTRIRWIALAAALLTLALGYASLTRAVTIMADGELTTVATRAVTVGGALKDAGLQLHSEDKVEPSRWSLLSNGLVINVERAARVQLVADSKTYSAITAERDPLSLLDRWGLELNEGDRLVFAGRTLAEDEQLPQATSLSLELRRPVQISLVDGDSLLDFHSSALTLGEAVSEQDIELFASDRLEPAAETPLDGPLTVTLIRAEPLLIVMGDFVFETRTASSTVGEALAEAGIALQGLDRSQPDEDQPIPTDRRIRVIRINETVLLEQETVAHKTEWQEDPEAELDTISVVQAGQEGVSASRVRVRYEDGQEVSRIEEGERVLVEARNQINGYGSQIVLKTTTVDGVTIEYYRAVTVFTTWYSPCNSGTGTCLNGTSSGMPVRRGTLATYLSWYRALKGTTVYVPDYGYAAFGDVGSYPTGEPWIDLAFSEEELAALGGVPWTNKYVTMYFTTPVPSYVPLIWPP
ncbi:MAG: ubiquitin-like domain-containing protein [Chloroflexi bacterium]|nr:ubiquitin-like domain-containing protein [Chloroflexota bacterium]